MTQEEWLTCDNGYAMANEVVGYIESYTRRTNRPMDERMKQARRMLVYTMALCIEPLIPFYEEWKKEGKPMDDLVGLSVYVIKANGGSKKIERSIVHSISRRADITESIGRYAERSIASATLHLIYCSSHDTADIEDDVMWFFHNLLLANRIIKTSHLTGKIREAYDSVESKLEASRWAEIIRRNFVAAFGNDIPRISRIDKNNPWGSKFG